MCANALIIVHKAIGKLFKK